MVEIAWFKVDDGFHSSKKLMKIPRRLRLQAAGAWLISGTWSAQEELDGLVPDYMLEEWGITDEISESLFNAGLWEADHDGVQFVNWGEYQPTRTELEENRRKEREKKAKWRAVKAEREAAREAARKTAGLPDVSPVDNDGEQETVALTESAPRRTCQRHANWDHDAPCRACMEDRKAAEVEDEAAAADARRTKRRQPHACPHGFPPYEACERCGESWPGR